MGEVYNHLNISLSTLVPSISLGSQMPIIDGQDTMEMSHASSLSPQSSAATIAHERKDEESEQPPRLPRHSTEIGPPIAIPRLKRRGLFGQVALVAEVEDPRTYSRHMKWFISFVVALAAIATPLGSSIFFRKSAKTLGLHSFSNEMPFN